MYYIAIDLGSYSIKFIHFRIEKKKVTTKSTHEIILELPEDEQIAEFDLWDNQVNEIKKYLNELNYEFQIIMNMNSEIISNRFLNVPAKNKKRAQMMVPFLVEEDLPFSLSECHFSETIDVKKNSSDILAGVIKKEHFHSFFDLLTKHELEPKILTNDVSVFNAYFKSNHLNYPESFCILEFGHEATRGYFFHHGKMVANHHSFVAGKVITEDISKTYNITIEEATIYKHQNAFVLTEDQFEAVNENQRDFAKLMEATLTPLLHEIRRWEIGFRVKHGVPIKEFYICGGTANINNFSNYISAKLGAKVNTYDPFMTCSDEHIDKDKKFRNKFAQVCTMMQTMTQKNRLVNFLRGDYSFNSNENLPLDSMFFIGVRVALVCFLLSTYLLVDQLITSSQSKELTKVIAKTLQAKGDDVDLSTREKKSRSIDEAPDKILSKLEKQEQQIEQEIKSIQSAVQINALDALSVAVNIISMVGVEAEILRFHSLNNDNFTLVLKAENAADLGKLDRSFKDAEQYEFDNDINEKELTITINGEFDK